MKVFPLLWPIFLCLFGIRHGAKIAPTITLNDGNKIPLIGYGTVGVFNETLFKVVEDAVGNIGYRHIDTAPNYHNQHTLGEVLESLFERNITTRDELFVTTKIESCRHSYAKAKEDVRMSLADLRLDYLDLVLIHFPYGAAEDGPERDKDGNVRYSDVDYLETWAAMEDMRRDGLIRSIGVSNFNSEQLARLVVNCKIIPAMNQIESHPLLNQKRLISLCENFGIKITAYSPLGKGGLVNDANFTEIGGKYGKTAAQVLIRYQAQRGVVVIPRTSNATRMAENFDIFNFELSQEDIVKLDNYNDYLNGRINVFPDYVRHPLYPFNIPY